MLTTKHLFYMQNEQKSYSFGRHPFTVTGMPYFSEGEEFRFFLWRTRTEINLTSFKCDIGAHACAKSNKSGCGLVHGWLSGHKENNGALRIINTPMCYWNRKWQIDCFEKYDSEDLQKATDTYKESAVSISAAKSMHISQGCQAKKRIWILSLLRTPSWSWSTVRLCSVITLMHFQSSSGSLIQN